MHYVLSRKLINYPDWGKLPKSP